METGPREAAAVGFPAPGRQVLMKMAWVIPVAAAMVMGAAPVGGQGGAEPLTVVAVRFYSPSRGTTTIEGVCELHLDAVASGAGPTVRYRLEVSVRDSAGLELQRSGWTREVPANVARAPGATSVETFELPPAEPGRYQVVVRAIPETGAAIEQAVTVAAFRARPAISDLLLGMAARQAVTDTGAVAAGEVRRGMLVMQTAPLPRVTPGAPALRYYAEVYPWEGASLVGRLSVAVLGSGGREVTRTSPSAVRFRPAGGVTEGSIDLTGLPAGRYRLQLSVRLGDSTLVDEAPFEMAPEAVAAAAAPAAPESAGPFAGLSETQLDSMYAPLVYLLEPREQGVYDRLAVEGKRRFLEQFWAGRNPVRGAAVNRAEIRFYRAVDYANRQFKEGGAGQIPGWRTDRGRIYLRNGAWDEILRRPMGAPAPYQVWKYTRGRPRYYVFVDRSGLGNYQLVATNDRQETGLPNWGQMMGVEDSTDVARFLGFSNEGMQ